MWTNASGTGWPSRSDGDPSDPRSTGTFRTSQEGNPDLLRWELELVQQPPPDSDGPKSYRLDGRKRTRRPSSLLLRSWQSRQRLARVGRGIRRTGAASAPSGNLRGPSGSQRQLSTSASWVGRATTRKREWRSPLLGDARAADRLFVIGRQPHHRLSEGPGTSRVRDCDGDRLSGEVVERKRVAGVTRGSSSDSTVSSVGAWQPPGSRSGKSPEFPPGHSPPYQRARSWRPSSKSLPRARVHRMSNDPGDGRLAVSVRSATRLTERIHSIFAKRQPQRR